MVPRVKMPSLAGNSASARARLVLASLAILAALAAGTVLAGCGKTFDGAPSAGVVANADPLESSTSTACSDVVLATLRSVLERVYREGLHGQRVGSAEYLITHSQPLRAAVESDNKPAARAAAHALLATGHMTNLSITRDGRPFIEVGGAALTPLRGTLTAISGAPIASYLASVWADTGFLTEAGGITQGLVALRANGVSVGGSPTLGAGTLGQEGGVVLDHVAYRYTSFLAAAYPSGTVRVYLLIPMHTTAPLCGHTPQDTTVNTLHRVAQLIYTGEIGLSAQRQVRRVQNNAPLLEAVAHREPAATERAIHALLNEHIVRLRVSAGGELLSDVGGPYVLGPVSAPLRLDGRAIGSFVLSIQDDEGYLRLTRRLVGLDVLMYMNESTESAAEPQLVKDSLGPLPGPALASVPASGTYTYKGRSFRVFTIHATAFPSGALTIRVLVPIPYL